jgi:hypothetical protein
MNRVALISILVAIPLLTASMLAQNDDRSQRRAVSVSPITADGAPASQYFNGQWFNGSDSTPDPFYAVSPFPIGKKSTGALSNRGESARPSNTFRAQLRRLDNLRAVYAPGGVTGSFGYFQPTYESSANQKLVESVSFDVAKLRILRSAPKTQYQPAQFTFEWMQSATAADHRTVAQMESAANVRDSAAARAHKAQRAPSPRHDPESEINCLISEEDARPALQRQVIVASSVDLAKLGEYNNIEPMQTWSDAAQAVITEVSSKVKHSGLTK